MSNSFVISGLTAKRAELSGEIGEAEKRLAQLRADLAALDTTLRLFDPTAKPSTIKPKVKRKSPTRFRAGEMTRSLLAILRKAERPMTVRDLALAVGQEHGLDTSAAAVRPLIANVRNALSGPRDGVVSDTLEDGRLVYRVSVP